MQHDTILVSGSDGTGGSADDPHAAGGGAVLDRPLRTLRGSLTVLLPDTAGDHVVSVSRSNVTAPVRITSSDAQTRSTSQVPPIRLKYDAEQEETERA